MKARSLQGSLLVASAGAAIAAALLFQTSRGWSPSHPTFTDPLEYANKGANQALDPAEFGAPEACGACHLQHYEEWRQSAMGRSAELSAFLVDLYELGLDLSGAPTENIAFCLHCHAPLYLMGDEAELSGARKPDVRGVTCDVCHTAVVAHIDDAPGHFEWDPTGPKRGTLPGPDQATEDNPPAVVTDAHGSVQSEIHQDSRVCGPCHMSLVPASALPIDWTYPEWERSSYAEEGIGCAACHMPIYRGVAAPGAPERDLHRHTFPGGSDLALVRSAATIEVEAFAHNAGHEIVVTVENTGAGHNFPTGNANFPVVKLQISASDGSGKVVFEGERRYEVVFADERGEVTYDPMVAVTMLADTTLHPKEPRHERFFVPARHGATEVRVELVYRQWSEAIVDNHSAIAAETVARFLREGVQIGRLASRFRELDYDRLERVRALEPRLVAETHLSLPELP